MESKKNIQEIVCCNGEKNHKHNSDLICVDENCNEKIFEPICP